MRIDVEELSPVKKSMRIELDQDEMIREKEQVLRSFAKKARVPGFRPGKVPLSVVRSRFAKEIDEDVRERVLSRSYHAAMHEKGLRPVGEPVVDEVNQAEGEPFSFKTTFEVLPDFELVNYRAVEVRRPAIEVTPADLDQALEELRRSRTKLVDVADRPSETGDVLVADVSGTPKGEGEPFHREGMMIELGSSENLPEFNERLLGTESGEVREFSVSYPAEYGAAELAGRSVDYKVDVHAVKHPELPELDDDFAKDLGAFADLAELRAKVEEDLHARKDEEAEKAVRQQLLDKVLLDNPIALPEVLIDREVRYRLEEMVRSLIRQGVDPEKVDLDWKEIRKQQEEPARKNVHARLVLDALAEAESVEVGSAEVDERIRRDARAFGESPQKLRVRLKEHDGLQALQRQLLREKSLDLLVSVANIQNEVLK